jgi:hypothetical protein
MGWSNGMYRRVACAHLYLKSMMRIVSMLSNKGTNLRVVKMIAFIDTCSIWY